MCVRNSTRGLRRTLRWPAQVLAALVVVSFFTEARPQVLERPIPGDPVTVESGRVAGTLLPSGVRAYLGVPFAAPPLRERRWQAPGRPEPWTGIRYALRAAPECIQTLRAHDINHYFGEEATSEDCLYLNIWAPADATATSRKPVLVWIYGGGFTIGSASMANYSGEPLAARGAVYVSIAYRLGALGFMAHPELTMESKLHTSGNWGFLDQIAALEWIQRNISAFGGDPSNVTIMGQSAGSMSVSLLQASPLARGLFHRAVGMSGASFGGGDAGATQALSAAEASGMRLQQQLGAANLAALRNVPADRILQAQLAAPIRYGAIVDGYFLMHSPKEVFAEGKQNDVPIMIGFTRDESFSELARATTLDQYRGAAERLYGANSRRLLELYPASDDASARRAATDAARDSSVGQQMHQWAQLQTATGKAPAYVYFFSRIHPYVPGVEFSDHDPRHVGAYHTGDVPYWLGTLESLNLFRRTRNWTEVDHTLSAEMSGALLAFAHSGDPNQKGTPDWPTYTRQREQVVEFGDSTRVISWPNRAKLEFFASNPPQQATSRGGARD
jgi:para-nitrobenzyl esterase